LTPEIAIPMHYDVDVADPNRFGKACGDVTRVVVLYNGESPDI
jgi:hypothetical protein